MDCLHRQAPLRADISNLHESSRLTPRATRRRIPLQETWRNVTTQHRTPTGQASTSTAVSSFPSVTFPRTFTLRSNLPRSCVLVAMADHDADRQAAPHDGQRQAGDGQGLPPPRRSRTRMSRGRIRRPRFTPTVVCSVTRGPSGSRRKVVALGLA